MEAKSNSLEMRARASLQRAVLLATSVLMLTAGRARAVDPLPSWNNTASKQTILTFVARVTRPRSPDFVPWRERIAVFDNDGTLWAEQPLYVQLAFAFDRVQALAPQHPEWTNQEPFASAIKGDTEAVLSRGVKSMLELVMAAHAGLTTEEFDAIVRDWITTAKHPRTGRLYTEMVYQPMLELLVYLRANGFKTYIVSGGGLEFMRPWTERVYGVPPEQVIGSTVEEKFELREGRPVLVRQSKLNFIDDGAGKAVAINRIIGRRPLLAFGNSDGDHAMLQWTAAGPGPRLMGLVHHTDPEREWRYDRQSSIGKLDHALDDAQTNGWTVVSMRDDWKTIFPPLR